MLWYIYRYIDKEMYIYDLYIYLPWSIYLSISTMIYISISTRIFISISNALCHINIQMRWRNKWRVVWGGATDLHTGHDVKLLVLGVAEVLYLEVSEHSLRGYFLDKTTPFVQIKENHLIRSANRYISPALVRMTFSFGRVSMGWLTLLLETECLTIGRVSMGLNDSLLVEVSMGLNGHLFLLVDQPSRWACPPLWARRERRAGAGEGCYLQAAWLPWTNHLGLHPKHR